MNRENVVYIHNAILFTAKKNSLVKFIGKLIELGTHTHTLSKVTPRNTNVFFSLISES